MVDDRLREHHAAILELVSRAAGRDLSLP